MVVEIYIVESRLYKQSDHIHQMITTMKKIGLIISMILVSMFTSAQIIHVPGDQTTIQAAINAASDGDTVLVEEGTYIENINFRGKAITVASHFLLDRDTSHISKTVIDGSQSTHPDTASVVLCSQGKTPHLY